MKGQLRNLGLVVKNIVLWNSQDIEVTLNDLKRSGAVVNPLDVARLSPLLPKVVLP